MNNPLPFFNWSLRAALESEPDSIKRARVRIIFTILLFSLAKSAIVIFFGSMAGQSPQVVRAVIAFIIYVVLLKMLLYRPSLTKSLAHIMILIGILIIWTNIFLYAHKVNLLTVQFVFMLMLSSFYVLGSWLSITYSIIGALPIVVLMVFKGNLDLGVVSSAQEFASPGYEIIVVLNFISIIISHYLFFDALNDHIAEKEKLNAQLQLAIADANKLAVSKSNFLSTMSHELRTPLNSVVGISELLLKENPEERQKENLKLLQFSAIDLLGLVNNVLDFNKMDSGNQALHPVAFNLSEFVASLCSVLKVKAQNKGLSFVVDIDKKLLPLIVVSDPTRLSQVLNNLVGNAIKFTDQGEIFIQLTAEKHTEHSVDVLFSITDTGIGIHPGDHESIFDLFSQAETQEMYKYGGTGLGLAIVKRVLADFESSINLESTAGEGSKFFFAISFDLGKSEPVNVKQVSACKVDLSGLKILIAEDNDITRLVLKKQLQNLNVQGVIVKNGVEAFELVRSEPFDAVFMDLHMPEMDGYEAIEKIRALKDPVLAGTYLVAFTASVVEQDKINETGFNSFLYKPFNIQELEEKLAEVADVKLSLANHN